MKSVLPFGTQARYQDEGQEIVILRGGFTEWVKEFYQDPELVEGYNSSVW